MRHNWLGRSSGKVRARVFTIACVSAISCFPIAAQSAAKLDPGLSDLVATMGQAWPGFSADQMTTWLADAGFSGVRIRPLPPDVDARGPALFLATGARPEHAS